MKNNDAHSLLVVGSLAFDSIETPTGKADDILGGSVSFFSYAASFFTKPRLVAAVGEDFPAEHRTMLAGRGIDLSGLSVEPGKTFRWKGRYHKNMNNRDTLEVHLNVLEHFDPKLPESFRHSSHVFLANSRPATQLKVLEQVKAPKLIMADTMDLWIREFRDELLALLPKIDGLFLNDSEAQLLTGHDNLITAGHAVRKMGPKFVVLKKGEHGAMLISQDGVFVIPAFPTETVVDPTGAGDSFAGGIMGYLASTDDQPPGRLRRAMAYGTVIASLTVEDFGLDRLKRTERKEIDDRLSWYQKMLEF
jgi:sugar/nucleoside kinase (ribokinase family)